MIDEGYPEHPGFDMADPRVRRLYGPLLNLCVDYKQGERAAQSLLDHRTYMQKIFGAEAGGAMVGQALRDAKNLNDLNVILPEN
jgi:hypothetical protein